MPPKKSPHKQLGFNQQNGKDDVASTGSMYSITENRKVAEFFNEIKKKFQAINSIKEEDIVFIVVAHVLPTLPAFINAINTLYGGVAGVILKSSHQDRKIKDILEEKKIHIITKTKEQIRDNTQCVVEIFNECVHGNKRCIIIDIGGYFSPCLKQFNLHLKDHIVGIVEDTENGHQKYETELKKILQNTIPIFSVARSELKKTEDYNVGKSIVQAADSILRKQLHQRLEDQQVIGVIGFGKIGKSIATHLRQKNIGIVLVYDRDPLILMNAASQDFIVSDKNRILQEANMIFCATGNKSLSVTDLNNLKKENVFIASCTSADDEFDLSGLQNPIHTSKTYSIYRFREKDNIVLLAHGNAVNFYYNAVVGEYIRSVQSALIACSIKLATCFGRKENLRFDDQYEENNPEKIHVLSSKEEEFIARLWLKILADTELSIEHNLMFDNQKFIGRNDELNQIFVLLNGQTTATQKVSNEVVFLTGMVGCGKTEIVKRFAHDNKEQYDLIWWVDYKHSRDTAFKDLAKKLNINIARKTFDEIIDEILERITVYTNFLLIYENCTYSENLFQEISRYKKITGGKRHLICIFESCNQTDIKELSIARSIGQLHSIGNFADIDVEKYIINFLDTDDAQIKSGFIQVLHASPLVLEKVIVYISQQAENFDVIDFLNKVDQITKSMIQKNTNNPDNIVKILLTCVIDFIIKEIKLIDTRNKLSAFELLLMLSLFDCSKISYSSLRGKIKGNFEEMILQLEKYCLITVSNINDEKWIFMHGTVREIIWDYLKKDHNQFRIVKKSLNVISELFNYSYLQSAEDIKVCEVNAHHVEIILDYIEDHNELLSLLKDNVTDCYLKLGSLYLYEYRDYRRSLKYYKKATAISTNHPRALLGTAVNYLLLINNYEQSERKGQLEEAISLANSARNEFQKASFNETEAIKKLFQAQTLIALACIHKKLYEMNPIRENKSLLFNAYQNIVSATTIFTELTIMLDEPKLAVAIKRAKALALHTMGGIHVLMGNLQDAKKELDGAIQLRRELAEDHLDLARSQQKYAQCLHKIYIQGDCNGLSPLFEAREFCLQAIDTQLKYRMHKNLADSYHTLLNILETLLDADDNSISKQAKNIHQKECEYFKNKLEALNPPNALVPINPVKRMLNFDSVKVKMPFSAVYNKKRSLSEALGREHTQRTLKMQLLDRRYSKRQRTSPTNNVKTR